jgi:hypothetical protein
LLNSKNDKKPNFMNQIKSWVFRSMMVLASLFAINANAVNIPITSFTCTQAMTATSTCVNGFFASGWQTPGGGYWQYNLNTSGYSGAITMTFNTTKSAAAGPATGTIWYSINGAPFVQLAVASGGTYAVSTSCATKVATLPPACAGVASLIVQNRMAGATANTATNRISSVNVFDAASSSCAAAPTAGSVAGTTICAGTSAALTLTGATAGAGISYQWQSSPNNITFTDISGATALSYNTPALSATTYYRVKVTCAGFGTTTTATATVTVNVTAVAAITGYTAPLTVGTTQNLSNVTSGGVWTSSNESAALVDLISGVVSGEFGGSSTISYSVTDGVTGCIGSSTVNVDVVWPNTLALYAGVNGNSTSVINVPGDVTSALYTTGFGANTPCGSGGVSGLTVPVAITTYASANPHVGYKVYPTAGNALNMFRIHARARISGTGPAKARIAYQSWSNGIPTGWISEVADVNLVTGSCGASANSWDFTSANPANPNPTVNGITDSLEVAVFPFASGAATGTFQLNDLEVYGIVTTNADCNAGTISTTADSVLPRIVNICDSGSRFLNYNVGFGGLAGVNILYQWQRSTDGINWSDVPAATGVVYQTPNFHAGVDPDTNFYRVVVTCDATGDTSVSTANVVTVNSTPANAGTISGALAPSAQFPMDHMLIGTTYAMSSTIPGGTWSSNDTSAISFGGTSTATPNIPGDAIITYRTSVGGCFGTSKDTVASYYPGTKALYIGKGGNSTGVYAATGATAASLTSTNFGASTTCGAGGISGLTNTTTVQSDATNGHVSTIVASTGAPFTVSAIRATVRKQPSGAYKAYLGYKPTGGVWTIDPTPVDVETDDCGYSHNELVFTTPVPVNAAGVEFGVFGYNGTATTTLQVNSISVIGSGAQLMNGSAGINTVNDGADVQLFPNPVTNVLNVTATENVNVAIFSVDGKKLMEQKNAKSIDVSNLASGMYLIQVYSQNNSLLKTDKFVKK